MSLAAAVVVLVMMALASYQAATGTTTGNMPKVGATQESSYETTMAELTTLSGTLSHADRALYALAAPFTL